MKFSRRDFIHAGRSVVGVSLVPSIVYTSGPAAKRTLLAIIMLITLPLCAEATLHGSNGSPPPAGLSKTVLNMNFGGDQFLNIAKSFGLQLSGAATPANLNSNGFPSGVLPGNVNLSQNSLPGNYFGHYTNQSTGISAMQFGGDSIIVYSGGQQVYPGLSPGYGTSIGNTTFLNTAPWNVEFAFGDTIATVQNSATTPGLVEIISSDANGFGNFSSTPLVQIHNVANLSATTVWTATKINSTTIDLQGSVWNSSMVPATGVPGVAAEAIYNPGSLTPTYLDTIPVFGTVTHSITNWILCKTGDLSSVLAGNNVSTPAVSSMTTLSPKWLRFMDMIGVQATSGQFQYLPTLSSASYGSSQWLPPYFGGTTAGTSDNYTISPGPSSPTSGPYADGEVIQFKADRSSIGLMPTLAINGRSTGAKPILRNQSTSLFFNLAGQPNGSAISSISGSGTTATVTTSSPHGFTTGQNFITNVAGNTPNAFNGNNVLATATGASTFTYANSLTVAGAVTGTTNPGQCKITIPSGNGLLVGNTVIVAGISGATGCNGTTTISAVDSATTIELAGTTFGGAYTSGGTVQATSLIPIVYTITGAVTGTTNVGQCKLTISSGSTGSNGLAVGNTVTVAGISGATGCNVTATISAVDSGNTFELAGTTFGGTYTSGGTASTEGGIFTPQVADGDIINLTFTASNFSGGAYTFPYYVNLGTSSFTGTVSGKVLTVSSMGSGRVTPGQQVTGSGLSGSATILAYGSGGTTGTGSNNGTYALDISLTGTPTGTSSRTGASNALGTVNSVSALSADLSTVISCDPILGGQGFLFGNSGGSGLSVIYAAAIAQVTPSVSITASGAAAEVVTPSFGGGLTASTLYTAQYRAISGGWEVNSGPLFVGIPLGLIKEFATRSGAGVYYNVQLAWTQSSASSFGTYLANNFGSIPVAVAIGNELWNVGQNPNHIAQNLGTSMGFTAINDGVYFQSIYGYYSWAIENISQAIVSAYVAAGGNRNNILIHVEMSGSDGSGCSAGCVGGQTGGVQTTLQSTLLTPTPASFTGTITPNTNGLGATLTVTGITGVLYPGFQINGSGISAGTHIATCLPAISYCSGNGTYQLDTTYGSTVGPIAMTATNVIYSAVGGWAATPTTNDFTAFPNRVADFADSVGYATYWGGAIVPEGSGEWTGSQSAYNPFFQAAANFAQGIATSNPTLVQSGLNVWSADANGIAVANKIGASGNSNGNNECGFLSSPTTFGFCQNAANAVITGTTGNSSTLTVTSVASGTIVPGMRIAIGGIPNTPVIQPYGTGGTTGTGNTGTYALSITYNPGSSINNTAIGFGIGTVQGWENIIAAFDSPRPSGKAKLGVIQYEGSLQEAFCAGGCTAGSIFLSTDPTTLAAQFTSNGWNLDPTYGYPGFGSGNIQTATNVVTLFLGYVNSAQYYNDALFMYQNEAAIHAARPFFSPAQYGIEGTPGQTATTGAPQWGMYPGDLSTPPLQNYVAQTYFNTH